MCTDSYQFCSDYFLLLSALFYQINSYYSQISTNRFKPAKNHVWSVQQFGNHI